MVDCPQFKAKLTPGACGSNVKMALRAISFVDSGGDIGGMPARYLERLIVCGKCSGSSIPPAKATEVFRKAVDDTFRRVRTIDLNPQTTHGHGDNT